MADLSGIEKRKLEKLFKMDGGYVLNFTDRTFSEFFEKYLIDIDSELYKVQGFSKAKRLRGFWEASNNFLVGSVLNGLIEYACDEDIIIDSTVLSDCKKIAQRLLNNESVTELDALSAINNERDFEVIADQIREAIKNNQPEGGLDRLHTFVNKFIRLICKSHGISINREKPLHSVFGEYVKLLRSRGHLESEMTERILKSNISIFEAFNDVRNNKSLAHDNEILNYEESLLIFNQIAASIRFIKALESKIQDK